MASLKKSLKAFIMLLRPPYWLMTGGLSGLTIIALQRGLPETDLLALVIVSAICITSGGFAFNDYIDQESDAIVKKNRPIPSKNLKPWEALLAAIMLFGIGIAASATINWLCVLIAVSDSVLLIVYSKYIKKFANHIVIFFVIFFLTFPIIMLNILEAKLDSASYRYCQIASNHRKISSDLVYVKDMQLCTEDLKNYKPVF